MTKPEYESRSYEDLSKEFKEKTSRAVELIHLMYNRLTLVDHMLPKLAIRKIIEDHGHIRGFSYRNISRNLPLDNPTTPRGVRTEWHKSIPAHNIIAKKLSNTELQDETNKHQSQNREDVIESIDYNELSKLNAGSRGAIPRHTAVVAANKNHSTELTFKIFKKNYEILHKAMNSSNEFIWLKFDMRGTFEYAETDVIK